MRNGQTVAAFEKAFAEYVGAKYAIALCNGTATLHTSLVALGVKPGDKVAVPPLSMSSTTIAVLHAGAVPVFCDVDERTWLMKYPVDGPRHNIVVSLYGLHATPLCAHKKVAGSTLPGLEKVTVDDAAQTLRPHAHHSAFTSYSFQASKILSTGEGGMLVTDDEELATRAREFSSLGYRMRADQPRIDPDALKSPTFDRHYSLGFNYRMADVVADVGYRFLRDEQRVQRTLRRRQEAAAFYRDAIQGCDWLTPQYVPGGWTHDYWTYAVACDDAHRAKVLAGVMENYGAEKPYPAWRLTYHEPAFSILGVDQAVASRSFFLESGTPLDPHPVIARDLCPVAESLQPRLLQFQTNDLASAERNATALRRAIEDLS